MRRRPQALFVSYSGALGGAERLLLDWAEAVPDGVALACPAGPLAESARGRGIGVLGLRARRLELRGSARERVGAFARIAGQAREIRAAVRATDPRCVVAWSTRSLLATRAARTMAVARPSRRAPGASGWPPLLFVHNDLAPSAAIGRVTRLAATGADRVVAASRAIVAGLDPADRLAVEVIHPGVDLARFAPAAVAAGPPEALVLGALVGWKRPDLALDALARARRELPDLRLRFVGEPLDPAGERLRKRLEHEIASLGLEGAATLHGPTEDVPAALARCRCLLHCADAEPFGLALVEALACGRPVVAPRAGGPAEIVDGSCGALYEPGDAAAAARALVDVVRRAHELAVPARARAEAHFDGRASARRFAAVVEELTR